MNEKDKFAVFNSEETFMSSFYKDLATFTMLAFCIYISQDNTWWTFVTGLFFLVFMFSKLSAVMKRHHKFNTKADLQKWVDSLPDDSPEQTNIAKRK